MFIPLLRAAGSTSSLVRICRPGQWQTLTTRSTAQPSGKRWYASASSSPVNPNWRAPIKAKPSTSPAVSGQSSQRQPPSRPSLPRQNGSQGGSTASPVDAKTKLQKKELVEHWYEQGLAHHIYRIADERLSVFRFQCYFIAGLALFQVYDQIDRGYLDPQALKARGIHTVITWLCMIVPLFLVGAASICVVRAGGQVHSIGMIKKGSEVLLEVKVRSSIPFVKRSIVAQPYDIWCSTVPANPPLIVPEYLRAAPLTETSASTVVMSVIRESFYKKPLRVIYLFFTSAIKFFTRAGLVHCYVIRRSEQGQPKVEDLHMDCYATVAADEKGRDMLRQVMIELGPEQRFPKEKDL